MNKVVIVSNFDTYLERIELLKEFYISEGYEVTIVLSNFMHFKKDYIKIEEDGFIFVKTKPYYKNLSIQRLLSHYNFSKKAFEEVERLNPDILHVLIPANTLVKLSFNYKHKNPDVILLLDIIDLWPETLPIGRFKKIFPFSLWKNLRDRYLENADIVFTECDLFQKIMNKEENSRFQTLYWAKRFNAISSYPSLKLDEINLCYLGSINNIIDIDLIISICTNINKTHKTILHIIGNGENKTSLIQKMEAVNITVIDYGVIYNKMEKQKIFDKCDFGLNIMKKTVCVGLTMKSLDYFESGLPIINNIRGDTWEFINRNNYLGVNIDSKSSYKKIFDYDISSRKKVQLFFQENLGFDIFKETLSSNLKNVFKARNFFCKNN